MASLLARLLGTIFLLSLVVVAATWSRRDAFPPPDTYDLAALTTPRQQPTGRKPFEVDAGDQRYLVEPLFDYVLDGVVVSYHDADSLADIWHHGSWRDFLNVRDLCVIWGGNVKSAVYQDMDFRNDSWTCWAYWPDAQTGARFRMDELSNNHLLTDDPRVKQAAQAMTWSSNAVRSGSSSRPRTVADA